MIYGRIVQEQQSINEAWVEDFFDKKEDLTDPEKVKKILDRIDKDLDASVKARALDTLFALIVDAFIIGIGTVTIMAAPNTANFVSIMAGLTPAILQLKAGGEARHNSLMNKIDKQIKRVEKKKEKETDKEKIKQYDIMLKSLKDAQKTVNAHKKEYIKKNINFVSRHPFKAIGKQFINQTT